MTVLEADPDYLGGISRTVSYKGFRCDIGGHRFFTKLQKVTTIWHDILGEALEKKQRKSRIYYNGKFFDYPLRATNALFNLGILQSTVCMLSYLKSVCLPYKHPANFEQFMCNRFGRRLFSIFFKSYTEKVWGMKCQDISTDWAAQRIKGFSLLSAIKDALLHRKGQTAHTTLIDSFHYPSHGCGMMWEKMGKKIIQQGGKIHMGQRVISLCRHHHNWEVVVRTGDGKEVSYLRADHVVSSLPMQEQAMIVTPRLPAEVLAAAEGLCYRDFLVVALMAEGRETFDDHWIYIHDPKVQVARIQNLKSWSPWMVPEANKNLYGMEYFCFEGDQLWTASDTDLVRLARQEMVTLGLAQETDIYDGFVLRQPKAYPVYDAGYKDNVACVSTTLADMYPTLHLIGRNGMHRYNNQDHSMLTAMLTVENIIAGRSLHDVWQLNSEAEYHEEKTTAENERLTPLPTAG